MNSSVSATSASARPGYPACPEHTEKATLWTLMDVTERTGIELTESMAMWPGAAVGIGWYFSHPQSQYFVVGRLAQDQVADYAKRKGWTLAEAERWLAPEPRLQPGGLRPTAARLPRGLVPRRDCVAQSCGASGLVGHGRHPRRLRKLWDVALKELYNRRGRVLAPGSATPRWAVRPMV